MSDTVDVNTMLAEEAKQIKERREHLESRYKGMKKLEDDHYLGLAFSGGGIRSGTFNLGILQGLTRIGLLPYVDYLSTVSGGGYIGTWLHGVINRHDLEETEKILERPDCERHLAPDEDPVAYLRQYSRYLAPELGLFSADFWVILAIWLRNVLLNQLMLIPFLALLILGALHVGYLRHVFVAHANPLQWILCLLLLLLGVVTIAGTGVRSVVNPTSCKERENNAPSRLDRQGWAVACAALVMSASVIVGSFAGPVFRTAWSWKQYVVISTVLFLLFVALQAIGGFLDCYKSQHSGHIRLSWLWLIIFPLAAATLTAGLLCVAMSWIAAWNSSDEAAWHVVAYGPPLIGLVWLAGAGFHIGLMAADFPDAGREWLARVAAFTTILIVGWALIFTVSVFGAVWISRIDGLRSKWGISLSGAWVLTTISGVLSGVSKRTGGKTDQHGRSDLLEVIAKVAPAVFVLGLL
ncbi:MAG: patatin-like phospholipase family protein, partial [Bryobacteraceae bacterium]